MPKKNKESSSTHPKFARCAPTLKGTPEVEGPKRTRTKSADGGARRLRKFWREKKVSLATRFREVPRPNSLICGGFEATAVVARVLRCDAICLLYRAAELPVAV